MPAFPCGYFQSAVFAWAVSCLIATKLSEADPQSQFAPLGAVSSFYALASMLVAIWVRAWLLGEVGTLLAYREEWKLPAIREGLSLEEGDAPLDKTADKP